MFILTIVQRISEKQMYSLPHNQLSLLLRAGDHWWVSSDRARKKGGGDALAVKEDSLVPPINGWSYYYGGNWKSDETLECSRTVSPVCAEVRIELVVTQ